MMDSPARSVQIENILIGMFGAFIGGDFVAAQFNGGKVIEGFQMTSLLLAIVGAIVMLFLLQLMRKVVGPMRKSVSKKKRDY